MVEEGRGLMSRVPILKQKILIALKKASYSTVTLLANTLGHQRPAVNISLGKLVNEGLVSRKDKTITLTPSGLEAARDVKLFKITKGSFVWVDDGCGGFLCPCGKYKEGNVFVSVEDITECDGCGRHYILRQRAWVEEVIE